MSGDKSEHLIHFEPLNHKNVELDMRVQDYWGRCGTVRWVGKFDKKHPSPAGQTGHHAGIEYDEESRNELRSDGTWNGVTYFQCAPRRGMLVKIEDLYNEVNPLCVRLLREHYKERVESWHDFELIKFGIARSFDMPKVYAMMDKHLQWRDDFRPSADEYFPPGIVEDYPAGYTGTTDNDENLIYCERPGNAGHCHPTDFVRKYTIPTIARWHACGVEMGMVHMRASNYRNKRVCYIVDLTKVKAMTSAMIRFARTLATVEQDNYPENLGRVFIVNCPRFFRFAWKLVSIFIDERTNRKINFVAPGDAVKTLRNFMPEDEIPDFCGGTSTKWMKTNGGRLGSDDATHVYVGASMIATSSTHDEEDDRLDGFSPSRFEDGSQSGPSTSASSSSQH